MTFPAALARIFPLAILLLAPTLIYWNTIGHRYGFRDDYSILRETHEEPGKVIRVCSMQARPLFGFLLEKSFVRLERVDDFRWMRLLVAGILGGLAALLYVVLRGEGWSRAMSVLVAGAIPLLPGAQVAVSWAVAWPTVLALLLALGGYLGAERAFRATATAARMGGWIAAVVLVVASALIYQANSLFYLVPLIAALSMRLGQPWRETLGWMIRHCATLAVGLGLAITTMMIAFAWGGVEASSRVALADDVGKTLTWFFHAPLANALAVFALSGTGAVGATHAAAVVLAVATLIGGVICFWKKWGWKRGMLVIAVLGIFPLAAYGVNLISTERVATYRTMIPLTALLWILMVASVREFAGRRVGLVIVAAVVAAGAWTAHRQPFDLIARPQGIELSLIEAGATRVNLAGLPRIFIITPTLIESPARLRYADEFGSLSTDSDWVPREMLAMALKRFFGEVRGSYTCESGRELPAGQHYDVVIDLGRLREFKER